MLEKVLVPKICPLNVMSVMWNYRYFPFLHESLQLLLEIKIKQVNSILPYIFHLKTNDLSTLKWTFSLVAVQLQDNDIWEHHSNRKE